MGMAAPMRLPTPPASNMTLTDDGGRPLAVAVVVVAAFGEEEEEEALGERRRGVRLLLLLLLLLRDVAGAACCRKPNCARGEHEGAIEAAALNATTDGRAAKGRVAAAGARVRAEARDCVCRLRPPCIIIVE